MKSAYELAMERLAAAPGADAAAPLSDEQRRELAEIDQRFQAKIAEREIFLQQRLSEVVARQEFADAEQIRRQITSERARLEEEREEQKEKVRRRAGR